MLHACNQRFDVTENLENFCELNKAIVADKLKRTSLCEISTLQTRLPYAYYFLPAFYLQYKNKILFVLRLWQNIVLYYLT